MQEQGLTETDVRLNRPLKHWTVQCFRFVNKSYVVNLKHILEIDGTSLVMRDGELIDLSVPQRSAVKKTLSDLWRGNLK